MENLFMKIDFLLAQEKNQVTKVCLLQTEKIVNLPG